MAISLGNLISKTGIFLHYQSRLIPRVERSMGTINCSKGREFGSSFPLRYIPKKYSESEKSQLSSPSTSSSSSGNNTVGSDIKRDEFVSKGVQILPNSSSRMAEFRTRDERPNRKINDVGIGTGDGYNGNMLFEDLDCMEEPEDVREELQFSSEKNRGEGFLIEAGRTKQDAEKKAVELLATRAFTAAELRKKLVGKKFPLDIVDAVVANFQSRGLINDGLYAETFSRSRWSSSTWGPRRIKRALFTKGVSNEDANKAVELVFNDAETTEDQESKFGMSRHSMDHLFVQASKQWLRSHDASIETRKSRIVRWLQYRGFSWDVIGTVLKKLESKYPP